MIRLRKWKLNRRALGLVAGALACVLLGAALRSAYEAYWSRQTADAPESDVESLATVVTDMLGPGASVDEPPPAFSWPVEGTLVGAFGWHRDLLSGEWRYRDGVRIQAPPSSTVRASAAGTVDAVNAVPVKAADAVSAASGGYEVRIKHSNDFETCYSPLEKVEVTPGVRVSAGAPLGQLPSEPGRAVLDFKLIQAGEPQNPDDHI